MALFIVSLHIWVTKDQDSSCCWWPHTYPNPSSAEPSEGMPGWNETWSFTAEGHPLPPADTRTLDSLLPPTVYNSKVLTNWIWSFWVQLWKIWLLVLPAVLSLVSRNHVHYKPMWILHPVKAVTHFFQGKENEERLKIQWLILNVASNFITSNILNFQKTFHTDPTYK